MVQKMHFLLKGNFPNIISALKSYFPLLLLLLLLLKFYLHLENKPKFLFAS